MEKQPKYLKKEVLLLKHLLLCMLIEEMRQGWKCPTGRSFLNCWPPSSCPKNENAGLFCTSLKNLCRSVVFCCHSTLVDPHVDPAPQIRLSWPAVQKLLLFFSSFTCLSICQSLSCVLAYAFSLVITSASSWLPSHFWLLELPWYGSTKIRFTLGTNLSSLLFGESFFGSKMVLPGSKVNLLGYNVGLLT